MRKTWLCLSFVILAGCHHLPADLAPTAPDQAAAEPATTTDAQDVPALVVPKLQPEPTAPEDAGTPTPEQSPTVVIPPLKPVVKPEKEAAPVAQTTTPLVTKAASTTLAKAEPAADKEAVHQPLQLKQQHKLAPFKASFRIYVSKIPMPITAELELSPQGQADTWKMRFEISSFLMHNLEESTFQWNGCHPRSLHYHHDFKGFGKRQSHDTDFFWNPPHVENHSATDSKSFAIPADAVDDLTVLLQASCALGEGQQDYFATSIYGSQIRENHFVFLRRETVDTPLGKLDTLVIEKDRGKKSTTRHTLFWVAPSLNYMLVKAKHIENTALFGEVIMKSYEGPHR